MTESSRLSYQSLTYSVPTQFATFGAFSNEQKISQYFQYNFFPLFTEVSKFGHLPPIIYGIQFILMIVQEIGTSFWCGSLSICSEKGSLFDYVFRITDWGIVRTTELSKCIFQYVTGYILFIIINGYLFNVMLFYKQKRNFDKWALVVMRFLFFPLLSYLIPIYGTFIGRSFYDLITCHGNSISISFFILSIPVYFVSLYELYYAYKFSTSTPIIDKSLLGTWDDSIIFLTVLNISIGSVSQLFFEAFPKWIHIVNILGYIFFVLYRIYLIYFAPMLRYSMNSFFMAVCSMSIINCIFAIVHHITDKIPSWIYLFISLVVLLISIIFSMFWFRFKKIKYLRQLSYSLIAKDSDTNPTESEKRENFDKIVFSSARDAISFLHIGVMFQADTIIDFSFLRYLMENYAQPRVVVAVSKVASFFPSETRFLSYCLNEVSKIVHKKLVDEYLIYQMKTIQVFRQSSVSPESSSQLAILQKMSKDIISQVRWFWEEILNSKTDISFASLQYLRRLTLNTDSAFLDACDRFPNNVSILDEYCKFQIEAMGNFSGAIGSSQKKFLLDQGKNLTIDYAFKALVNVYPDYLLKNIFSIHGNLIKNGIIHDSSSFSFTSTISTQDDLEEKYEEIISQLYSNGKLRIALQMRMKSTKLWPFKLSAILSCIQLIFSVLLFLLIIIIFPILNSYSMDIIECCNDFSKVSLNLQYISSVVAIQSAIKSRAFSGVNMLRSQLGISSSDLTKEYSFFQNHQKVIFNYTRKLRQQFDTSTRELISTMHSIINDIPTFSDEIINYAREGIFDQYLSIQSSVAHYCYVSEIMSSVITTSSSSTIQMLSREILLNTEEITTGLEILQFSINEKGIELIESNNNLIEYIFIIIIGIGSFILIAFRIYNHFTIIRQMKEASKLLRSIDHRVIKESFKPIALKGESELIKGTNPPSAHEYNYLSVWHPILIFFSIFVTNLLLILSILTYFDSLDIIYSSFQWFLFGNIRFSSIFGSLIILCEDSIDFINVSNVHSMLESKIELLLLSQKYIDLTLMNIDPRLSKSYFSTPCSSDTYMESYKQYAECLPLSSKIYVATAAIQNIFKAGYSKNLNNQDFTILIYLADNFLLDELDRFQELVVQYSSNHFDSSSEIVNGLCIGGLVITCILFLIEQTFFMKYQQSVDAIKQLISMLPPISVVNSNVLMNFINCNTDSEDSEMTLSASESIISMASTPAVMLDKERTIQAVNKAVNDTTGFTPDQILGQNVNWLIPPPSPEHGNKVAEINKRFYLALDKISQQNNFDSSTNKQNDKNEDHENDLSKKESHPNLSLLLPQESITSSDSEGDILYTSTTATIGITSALSVKSITQNDNAAITQSTTNTQKKNANNLENAIYNDSEDVMVLNCMCLTESGKTIPTKTTIIYIKDRATFNDQYILMIRDMSEEMDMIKEAQEVKLKATRLLSSLIPPSVASSVIYSLNDDLTTNQRKSDFEASKEFIDSRDDESSFINSVNRQSKKNVDYIKFPELNKKYEKNDEEANHEKENSTIEPEKESHESDKGNKNLSKEETAKTTNEPEKESHESDKGNKNSSKEETAKTTNEPEKESHESDKGNKNSSEKQDEINQPEEFQKKKEKPREKEDFPIAANANKKSSKSDSYYSDEYEYESVKIDKDPDSDNEASVRSDQSYYYYSYEYEEESKENSQNSKGKENPSNESSSQPFMRKEHSATNLNQNLHTIEPKINKEESDTQKTANSLSSVDSKERNKTSNSITNEFEKNSVFRSDIATIIVIQVVGLNECVHVLPPQKLMYNLKVIFEAFDSISRDFPAISILKMGSQQFVACCGLFSYFNDFDEQVKQAVSFSIQMIKKIESINEDLDIDLHLKIGINLGGPVIASMLSPMTPSFEVVGDFIKIAYKIQFEAEVDVVSVSQDAVSHLDQNIFKVEKGLSFICEINERQEEINVFHVNFI